MRRVLVVLMCVLPVWCKAALVEEVVQISVSVRDAGDREVRHSITLTIFRDDTRTKSPFLILNHGRAGTAEGRARLGRARYADNAAYFVERGFAVFVPTRVGYGVTGGPDIEIRGACDNREFAPGFEAAAAQSLAVIAHAKSQTYVESRQGLLMGQSYGGATTVALAAKNIDGVQAAVNFAGGSGGNPVQRPENPCSPQVLERTYADYGKTARTPMLWLFSENDRFWGADYPRHWFAAYRAAGGAGEFVQLPAHGKDGHSGFTSNPNAWKPHFEAFLKSIGFTDRDL